MSLNAYQRARTMTETPRHTEYRLISEITGEMMQAQAEGRVSIALIPELHRNRELWNTLSAACALDPARRRSRVMMSMLARTSCCSWVSSRSRRLSSSWVDSTRAAPASRNSPTAMPISSSTSVIPS